MVGYVRVPGSITACVLAGWLAAGDVVLRWLLVHSGGRVSSLMVFRLHQRLMGEVNPEIVCRRSTQMPGVLKAGI